MEMREKLIELLSGFSIDTAEDVEFVADYLIANGVTIPVRCKDCTQWMYEYDDIGLCVTDVPDIDGVQRRACDFCSYGERKDNDCC